MSTLSGGSNEGAHGERPGGGTSASAPAGERSPGVDDLVYINRMTTVGQVLPSVAHELNNALQVIGGLVELLGMRGELSPDVQDKIQKIGIQANRSAGMMREFVAFTRRDETMPRVDLTGAIDNALNLRRYHLSRARIDVKIHHAPQVGPISLQADSHAVLQVLLNLIINAEEALSSEPQGKRELAFHLAVDEDAAICEVRDSGVGFDGALRDAACEPFFSTKTKGAAGLGLAVARALVERDRGELRLLEGPGGRVRVRWKRIW